jgi:hypothetical protein
VDTAHLSRRSLLQAIATTVATAALPYGWADIAHAAAEVRDAAQGSGPKLTVLSAADAADVEAVASQIIPTDDSPGARHRGFLVGQRVQGAPEGVPPQHAGRRSRTSLALESNNVTLDPDVKDAWGLPAIRVTYTDHPDDLANARFLRDRGAEI